MPPNFTLPWNSPANTGDQWSKAIQLTYEFHIHFPQVVLTSHRDCKGGKHKVRRPRLFQESIDPPQLAHMKPTMISTLDTPLLRLLLQQASTCKANTLRVHPTHVRSHANPTKLMTETVGKRQEGRMWLTRWVRRRGLPRCYHPTITGKNNTG